MSSTYVAFGVTKPAGSSTGPTFANDANSNDVALWYAIISGSVPGFVFSITAGTGTAEQPQFYFFTNGVQKVRATNTWGVTSGGTGNITQQIWDVSQDTGATYANVCTQTFTYDASGNITATTAAGAMQVVFYYLIGKVKALLAAFNTHAATAGTGVHSLGTMSTQTASAVAVTGGAIDGTIIGGTTPAASSVVTQKETAFNRGNLTGAVTIDWSAGGYQYATVTGNCTITWSNLPAAGSAQGLTLELTNGGAFTVAYAVTPKWPGGVAPTYTAAGIDIMEFLCRDGGVVRGAQAQKNSS